MSVEMPSAETVIQANKQTQAHARFTCTLQGSQWDVAYYGIVEFLRVHPAGRAAVGVLGVLLLVLLVADWVVTVPGVPKGSWIAC
jgi:hypothetical protein